MFQNRLMPAVKKALDEADASELLNQLDVEGEAVLELSGEIIRLTSEDVLVRLHAKQGWTAARGPSCVVVLSTELTPQLLREGIARDLVRLIQQRRKELDCKYTDRIRVGVVTASEELKTAADENSAYIQRETLAVELKIEPLSGTEGVEYLVSGHRLTLYVKVC